MFSDILERSLSLSGLSSPYIEGRATRSLDLNYWHDLDRFCIKCWPTIVEYEEEKYGTRVVEPAQLEILITECEWLDVEVTIMLDVIQQHLPLSPIHTLFIQLSGYFEDKPSRARHGQGHQNLSVCVQSPSFGRSWMQP